MAAVFVVAEIMVTFLLLKPPVMGSLHLQKFIADIGAKPVPEINFPYFSET